MLLDIKSLANSLTDEIAQKVKNLKQVPQLTIVTVGNNDASAVYVRNKIKTCTGVGIGADLLHLDETITEAALIAEIMKLNTGSTNGILVQSPLPKHINAQRIFDTIDPAKDVDGFSSANISKLYSGDESGLVPGTPKGVVKIIENYFATLPPDKRRSDKFTPSNEGRKLSGGGDIKEGKMGGLGIEGKTAVVIGKSTIVGKPLSMLLLHAGVTVTICHSKTKDLASHTQHADIVISAVGRKNLITADMIRPGSIVVDVGINVVENSEGRKLFGDCDTDNIAKIADITPVPGGVGPMTIAMLLENVLTAYTLQNKSGVRD